MSKYTIEDSTLTAVADKLREKTGTAGTVTPEEMPEKVDEVFEAGERSEWERFWDALQMNGLRRQYEGAFYGLGWDDVTFTPKHDIVLTGTATNLFRYSAITNIREALDQAGVSLNTSGADTLSYAFFVSETAALPKIDFSAITTTAGTNYTFANAKKLKVLEIGVTEKTPFNATMMSGVTALEDFTVHGVIGQSGFDVHWSTRLTHASLMSIINALQDKAGQTGTWTVTLGGENLAKLTEEEIGVAEAKGWVLA